MQKNIKLNQSFLLFLVLTGFSFFMFFSYWYPRFLATTFGEKNIWVSYLYTYGMGGLVFSSSLFWIFTRKKNPARQKEEIRWLIVILLGFFCIFSIHGLCIYFASVFPIKN